MNKNKNNSNPLSAKQITIIFASLSIILWLYFKALDLHIQLFKAESGIYLTYAFGGSPIDKFINNFILHSYNGHFAPIAFSLELFQSRIFNVIEDAWFVRQILAVAALWMAISLFIRETIENCTHRNNLNIFYGVGLASIFVFQPIMIELIAWPFLVYQILSLATATLSVTALYRFGLNRNVGELQIALGAGYVTMHLFGVGLAFSVAAIATALVVITLHKSIEHRRQIFITLGIAVFFTLAHAFLMTRGHVPSPQRVIGFADAALRFGYLFMDSIYMGTRALWANGGLPWPAVSAVALDSVYGWATIITISLVIFAGWRKCKQTGTGGEWVGIAVFLMVGMLTYTALITFRSLFIKDIAGINAFLVGGRYVIFPSFFVFFGIFCAAKSALRYSSSFVIPSIVIVALAAILGNLVFMKTVIPNTWPWMSTNHSAEWGLLVEGAREKINLGQPIADVEMTKVDPEVGQTLRSHRGMLENSLHCKGCAKFIGDEDAK
jgi:hypothetical protein